MKRTPKAKRGLAGMVTATESKFTISEAKAFTFGKRLIVHGWSNKPLSKVTVETEFGKFDDVALGLARRDVTLGTDERDFQPGWSLVVEGVDARAFGPNQTVSVRAELKDGNTIEAARRLELVDDLSIVELVKSRYPVVAEASYLPPRDVITAFEEIGQIPIKAFHVNPEEFADYMKTADYKKQFPAYVKEFKDNLEQKALEHFIGFQIIPPKAGRVYVDVAASNSPCAEILRSRFGVEGAYGQDLNYKAGIHDRRIGCNASTIPLKSASVTGLYLHNSWEHFEGWSDIEFLIEASRLLSRGGRLAILPMEFSSQTTVWTSPSIWSRKYIAARDTPNFDSRTRVVFDEKMRQRQIKVFSIKDFLDDIKCVPDMDWTLIRIQCADKSLPVPHFALRGIKT